MNKHYIVLLLLCLLTSCANYKEVPYFQNSAEFDGSQHRKRPIFTSCVAPG